MTQRTIRASGGRRMSSTACKRAAPKNRPITVYGSDMSSVREKAARFMLGTRKLLGAEHFAKAMCVRSETVRDIGVFFAFKFQRPRSNCVVEIEPSPFDKDRVQRHPGNGVSFWGHGFTSTYGSTGADIEQRVGIARDAGATGSLGGRFLCRIALLITNYSGKRIIAQTRVHDKFANSEGGAA